MSSKLVMIDGKEYLVELTKASHDRVKKRTEISLPDCVADISGVKDKAEREKALDGYYKLLRDFDKLPEVVYSLIQPQLEKNNVAKDRFDECFNGTVASACAEAITEALIDFFQSDPRGPFLRAAVDMAKKAAKVDQKWTDRAVQEMDRRLKDMETAIAGQKGSDAAAKMIQETLTNSSTTLPESLASILAPSP